MKIDGGSEEWSEIINSYETIWQGVQCECSCCANEKEMWSLEYKGEYYGYCAMCDTLIKESE